MGQFCSDLFSRENLLWEVQLDDSLELHHLQDSPQHLNQSLALAWLFCPMRGSSKASAFATALCWARQDVFGSTHSLSLFLLNLFLFPGSSAYPFSFSSSSFTDLIPNTFFCTSDSILGSVFHRSQTVIPNPNTTKLSCRKTKPTNQPTKQNVFWMLGEEAWKQNK